MPSKPRSVVWITPVENADLYIDYQNSGNITKLANIARLQSVKIFDPVDNDMSGAMIFATVKGGNITSRPVNSKCHRIDHLHEYFIYIYLRRLCFFSFQQSRHRGDKIRWSVFTTKVTLWILGRLYFPFSMFS